MFPCSPSYALQRQDSSLDAADLYLHAATRLPLLRALLAEYAFMQLCLCQSPAAVMSVRKFLGDWTGPLSILPLLLQPTCTRHVCAYLARLASYNATMASQKHNCRRQPIPTSPWFQPNASTASRMSLPQLVKPPVPHPRYATRHPKEQNPSTWEKGKKRIQGEKGNYPSKQ